MTEAPAWVIHAPNIHTGGGLHLLTALLRVAGERVRFLHSDMRALATLGVPAGCAVVQVKPSLFSRLKAEWTLAKTARANDLVLCFHGLPPLLPVKGRVVVFVHSRLLVTQGGLTAYPWWVRLRVTLERMWLTSLGTRAARFIVQTPGMAVALRALMGKAADIRVVPFMPEAEPGESAQAGPAVGYDFVYVASGEAHKNHRRLLDAWVLLRERGLTPSLALTVDPTRDPELSAHIAQVVRDSGIACVNLGAIARDEVMALYRAAKAMVYPSWTESFGMPLLEAAAVGLPTLAPELDYVRDVVVPVEVFDPHSALSIARAVERFLGRGEQPVAVMSGTEFVAAVTA